MPGRILLFLGVAFFLSPTKAIQFEWASPLPHRQSWTDMAVGNGRFVGVTDGFGGRRIFVSEDGVSWKLPASQPQIWAVKFSEGMFIGIAETGSIFTSTNAEAWIERPLGLRFGSLSSVATGNGVTVVGAYGGVVMVSRDWTNWTRVMPFESHTLPNIAFGNGRFLAVTHLSTPGPTPATIWSSVDGLAWTAAGKIDIPQGMAPFTYGNILFSNGLFAMNAGNGEQHGLHISPDGVKWTVAELRQRRLFPTEGGFLGVDSEVAKSADGKNWEFLFMYARADQIYLTCAAELNGTIVAAGTHGMLFVRTPGSDWRRLVNPVDYTRWKVACGNGEFIRYGESGIQASVDGTVWTPIPDAPVLANVVFGNGVWVGVKTNGTLAISADGRSWSEIDTLRAQGVKFGNGIFVAETDVEAIGVSRDGRKWSRIDLSGVGRLKVFGYANGRWAGLAYNPPVTYGLPATSEDGETWTVHPWQAGIVATHYAAGNDRFIGVRNSGMGQIDGAWSFDGVTWHTRTLHAVPTSFPTSLTFGGGTFLMTDYVGKVFYSNDGINWGGWWEAPRPFDSAAYGGGRWLVAGGEGILRSVANAQPMRPTLVFAHTSATTMSITLNGESGQSYDVEASPAVNGPWSVLRRVETADGGRGPVQFDVSEGVRFLRAVKAP